MPINPELKHLYPPDWKDISQRIRFERAGGKCEQCGAEHNGIRLAEDGTVISYEGVKAMERTGYRLIGSRIILTTAHLNHDPSDNREENLAALCQRCHLAHDLKHHLESRRINREKATGQQRLFERR